MLVCLIHSITDVCLGSLWWKTQLCAVFNHPAVDWRRERLKNVEVVPHLHYPIHFFMCQYHCTKTAVEHDDRTTMLDSWRTVLMFEDLILYALNIPVVILTK